MSCWRRDAHQCFAEIAALQHADEGGRCVLKAVRYVLAIADSPIGDSSADIAQEGWVVLGGEFVVDVAAQSRPLLSTSRMVAGRRFDPDAGPVALY